MRRRVHAGLSAESGRRRVPPDEGIVDAEEALQAAHDAAMDNALDLDELAR